jgi:lysophospholipase L1-like esterase
MRHALATVALAPVLFWQGRRVRADVPRLPEPEGERHGIHGVGPRLKLLILGDSAAAGVGATTQAEALSGALVAALEDRFELHWRLVATTGHTTAEAIADVSALPTEPFDVVITSLGVNDVTSQHSLSKWRRQQIDLIAVLQSQFAAGQIYLSGLPPMHRFPALPQPLRWYIGSRAKQFDQELAKLAAQVVCCEFVPLDFSELETDSMASDGFHPGPAIYRQWAAELARRITARYPSEAA